jgi:Flp pilus assembly protein TadG
MPRLPHTRRSSQNGSSLVEFAILAIALFALLFTSIEFDRMAFVYVNIADAAKAGVRYAIVHGSDRTGSGLDGPSSGSDYTNLTKLIKYYTTGMDTSAVTVTATYTPDNNPGSTVNIKVTYPYTPLTGFPFPAVTLSAMAQGKITF